MLKNAQAENEIKIADLENKLRYAKIIDESEIDTKTVQVGNTVSKAYIELEKNGYVYNIPKKGVYVSDIDLKQSHSNQIVKVLQPLKDSGIQKQELMDAIEILYKEEATC